MAEPPRSRLQSLLQAAVQTVQWTYSIFWQFCPQQGVIVWSDGYYNGAIKTRKTVQATEESAEEATRQRSQQLRELYDCLAGGDTSQRPSAALSPEDLTESEWFYLMCVSFSFPPGVGLPGKAYVDRQHIWLRRANKADSRLFSRTILADSAKIQTVLCIPLLDGVVELGTTERVEEDTGLIQRVKSFFSDCQNPKPPRPALSGHSTSNPTSSGPGYYYPAVPPPFAPPQVAEQEEEEEDEEEEEVESDSDPVGVDQNPVEAMQLDMSDQDIRVGSPDDSSNNLGSNFHHLPVSHRGASSERCGYGGLDRAVTMLRYPIVNATLQPPHSVDIIAEEDTHYSQTVSSLLENQSNRWSKLSSSGGSAFSKWLPAQAASSSRQNLILDGASQWVLKYMLFTLPLLNTKPREDLSGNHVLAERRRREKLNERFVVLRSMVPFVTKMDKASILGDTIEYLKQLKKRIQQLEAQTKEKRKLRMAEAVEVSIIESDALVEISCLHRGGLLLDVMQMLRGLGIHVTTVQSSINNATFYAEMRAKVTESANGRRPSIMEVKTTIKQIIQHH